MHGSAGFQNVCEKALTFTVDVHHDLLIFVLCRAVANGISVILYFFSFFWDAGDKLSCWMRHRYEMLTGSLIVTSGLQLN